MQFGPYTVEIKNRDKVFFPAEEITKGDLIDYYDDIADRLLPYLKDRPLTLRRFPDGIEEEGFYHKARPDYFPEWIPAVTVDKEEGGSIDQIVCNNKASLIYLINQGTVELHPWLSAREALGQPDRLVFDLDPPEGNFELVQRGAKLLHTFLEDELQLAAFLMTTGSQGMHVVCPIKADHTYETVRTLARSVAEHLSRQHPEELTTEVRKNKRDGRLFLDYLRNAYAQTSVAPYSVRAQAGAPVATPLAWDERGRSGLTAQSYHIGNIFRRLSQKEDPWESFHRRAVSLGAAIDRMEGLES